MGRLRNFSQSLKAAAFQNRASNGQTSPTEQDQPGRFDAQTITIATKEPSSAPLLNKSSATAHISSPPASPVARVYETPIMPTGGEEQIEELKPVFSFLSSHQNKLYQEGYFLKLTDLDTNGKPNADRNWTECFAQLVGTVLSLWDASALDAAGQDGEVPPTFINLADASVKMIETLPTRNQESQPLQNVLSISTAGKNRHLLHFNSLHSLTQWTAGIRLAMFEHASLQELYTGSLIAGKGKQLNNIRSIMQPLRFKEEDWCRVRFGAGTPWRRCWYVIDPPDEKEMQKANKSIKKRGTYERPVYPKGDLKFYDSRKTKKATPIATISDVYSAYAVYPQSKPLIDQSTLVKLEGRITVHAKQESKTEGFVFVMPEVHPAVSGFEMMLRFLFPIYDTFNLYGRPTRLVADKIDSRSLMFAMPSDRRYGYLDILDVAGLIHADGSGTWTERDWRKRMKEVIARRLSMSAPGRVSNVEDSRRSLGSRPGLRFHNGDSSRSNSGQLRPHESTDAVFETPRKSYVGVPAAQSAPGIKSHMRTASDSMAMRSPSNRRLQKQHNPSRLQNDDMQHYRDVSPPAPPSSYLPSKYGQTHEREITRSPNSSDSELHAPVDPEEVTRDLPAQTAPTPVAQPTFQHQANDQPSRRPRDRPDLRRENSRMSNSTLSQLVDANKNAQGSRDAGHAAASAAWKHNNGRHTDQPNGVITTSFDNARTDANSSSKELIDPSSAHVQSTVSRKPVSRPTVMIMDDREGSPDYASVKSVKQEQKPRRQPGGVRRTVGDPNHSIQEPSNILNVDFGITHSFDFLSRRSSSVEKSPAAPHSRATSGSHTPQEERNAYLESPVHQHSSRPSLQMWQPGAVSGGQSPNALTPEEFVQLRYAASRIPNGHATKRSMSRTKADDSRASSPASFHQRVNSRPSSRGSLLDFTGSVGHLSAREQEHVAKLTGGSLLNIPGRSKTPDPAVGLIGAIEQREQDRRNMKEGIAGTLVYNTVAQRQQAQIQAQAQAQHQYMQQLQAQQIHQAYQYQQSVPPQYYQHYQPHHPQNIYSQHARSYSGYSGMMYR